MKTDETRKHSSTSKPCMQGKYAYNDSAGLELAKLLFSLWIIPLKSERS